MAARSAVSRKKLGEWIIDGKEPTIIQTDKDPPKDSWHKRFCNCVSVTLKEITKEFDKPSPIKPRITISNPIPIEGMEPKIEGFSLLSRSTNTLPSIQEDDTAASFHTVDLENDVVSPESKSGKKRGFWKKATNAMDPRALFKDEKRFHMLPQDHVPREEKRVPAVLRKDPPVTKPEREGVNGLGAFRTLFTRDVRRASGFMRSAPISEEKKGLLLSALKKEEEEEEEEEEDLDVISTAAHEQKEDFGIVGRRFQISPSMSPSPFPFPSRVSRVESQPVKINRPRPLSAYHDDGSRMSPNYFEPFQLIKLSREDCPEDLLKYYDNLVHLKNPDLPYRAPLTHKYFQILRSRKLFAIKGMHNSRKKWERVRAAKLFTLRTTELITGRLEVAQEAAQEAEIPSAQPIDVPRECRFPTEDEIIEEMKQGAEPPKFMTVEVAAYRRNREAVAVAIEELEAMIELVYEKEAFADEILELVLNTEKPPVDEDYAPYVYPGGSDGGGSDTDEGEETDGKADDGTAGNSKGSISTHKGVHVEVLQEVREEFHEDVVGGNLYNIVEDYEDSGEEELAAKYANIRHNNNNVEFLLEETDEEEEEEGDEQEGEEVVATHHNKQQRRETFIHTSPSRSDRNFL